MLAYEFGVRAMVGGVMIASVCSVLSFFIIVRRLSFAGVGLSHAAFGGLGVGIWLGLDPIVSAAVFSVGVSGGIGWLSRKGRLHEDTVIGILFSASMALGIVMISLSDAYNQDLLSYLFGSILAMSWNDIIVLAGFSVISLAFLLLFFKELLFTSFDEETAIASGVPARFVYYGLLVIMALMIVVSIKLVGIILVSALLVIPGATGMQLSKSYRGALPVSLAVSVISVVSGLLLSFHMDVASGAMIVLVLFGFFMLGVIFSPRRSYIRRTGV